MSLLACIGIGVAAMLLFAAYMCGVVWLIRVVSDWADRMFNERASSWAIAIVIVIAFGVIFGVLGWLGINYGG